MVQTSTTFGFKDIQGFKESEFVAKTLFLLVDLELELCFGQYLDDNNIFGELVVQYLFFQQLYF